MWMFAIVLGATALAAEVKQNACLLQRNSRHGDQDILEHSQHEVLGVRHPETSRHNVATIDDDPRVSLRLELHIPSSLQAIHKGKSGPLPDFLGTLRTELTSIGSIPKERLDILGIRGESFKLEKGLLLNAGLLEVAIGKSQGDKLDTNTIVDFELLPGRVLSDATPRTVFMMWTNQLDDATSKLMTGSLSEELKGAALAVGSEQKGRVTYRNVARPQLSCYGCLLRISLLLLLLVGA